MIVEGILILTRIRNYANFFLTSKIFVHADSDEIVRRLKKRDISERGRDIDEVSKPSYYRKTPFKTHVRAILSSHQKLCRYHYSK